MAKIKTIEPRPDFADPRDADGFVAARWPLCDGEDAPRLHDEGGDLHVRRCIEFLASYYTINCLNAALLEARQEGDEDAATALFDQIDAALAAQDELEDRYAPVGFYGEPEMDGVFYRDLRFNRPGLVQLHPVASQASSHITIPGLEFLPPEELEGEITIERWP